MGDEGRADGPTAARSAEPSRRLPTHLDERAVREELTRTFSVCSSCRQCVDLCAAFPRLFDRLAVLDGEDPGLLTPFEQDEVVDACHQCDRCTVRCPYAPGRHEASIDVAGLMTTAKSMQRSAGHRSARESIADRMLDPSGRLGFALGRVADGGRRRSGRFLGGLVGVTPVGIPRRRASRRFSAWFGSRSSPPSDRATRRVVLLPTCGVEHRDPELGIDAVEVLEAAGGDVELAGAGCCGAYWLQVGDLDRYRPIAEEFVRRTAEQLRTVTGGLVVLHPTCGAAISKRSAELVRQDLRADAEFVAGLVRGVADFVLDIDPQSAPDTPLGRVVFAASCHGASTGVADAAEELLRRAGADVIRVETCPGVGGPWGARPARASIAAELGGRADRTSASLITDEVEVVGDCPDANAAVAGRTGRRPVDPVALLARVVRGGWALGPGADRPPS